MNFDKLKEFYFMNERKILFSVILLFALFSFSLAFVKFDKVETKEEVEVLMSPIQEEVEEVVSEDVSTIFIDIKGEVEKPGVYEIEEGKRVIDAVFLAGGFRNEADTSSVNLSKVLVDEDVVVISSYKDEPSKVEDYFSSEVVGEDADSNGLVNINTATKEELMELDGIGESKAKNIIKYRQDNGKFNDISDLLLVSGIGESVYEKIKEDIKV